jgi:hypothetical protein
MRKIIAIVFGSILFSCTAKQTKTTEHPNPQVGVDFLNAYIANCNKYENAVDILEWSKANSFSTKIFKTELEAIVKKAWKEDPELGLGFDPILNAQDYPDEGVELLEFDSETGYLTVKGVDWDSFQVKMRMIIKDGKTMVDGSGVINMPEVVSK